MRSTGGGLGPCPSFARVMSCRLRLAALAGVLCLILGLVPGPVGAIQPEWCQATAACSVPGKSARACWLAWHLAGMLPWMSSQNLIGRPTRARSRLVVCRSLFGPEPRLLSRSGCSVVRQPQNGRRYGGFASRPPQATCNVQAIRSPSRPCEPGELNRGPHRDHLPSRPASG